MGDTQLRKAPAPTDLDRLLTKEEVCAAFGVTYTTIWRQMREGKFPRGVMMGGQVRWRASDLRAHQDSLPRQRLLGDPRGEEADAA